MNRHLINTLDTDQRRALENVRAAAARIWSRPLHRYYTDHTVDHSERVIALLDGLTAGMMATEKRLSPTEVLILLSAAYLHDIGMQNERFAGGDPSASSGQRLEEIRAHHHEQTAEMIYAVFEDPAHAFPIPLARDPGLVEAVALVAKGHRRVDLNGPEYEPLVRGGGTVRLRLLAALLRFGDELNIDHRRVDLEQMQLLDLPVESQLHWWKCHYVSGVSIVDEYIRVSYRFPQDRPDYEGLIVPLVEGDIRAKLADLEEIFRASAVKVRLGKPQVRLMRLVQLLPPEVERSARQALAGSEDKSLFWGREQDAPAATQPSQAGERSSGGVTFYGDVEVHGYVAGRDKIVHDDEVHGDKVVGFKIEELLGDVSPGAQVAIGKHIKQTTFFDQRGQHIEHRVNRVVNTGFAPETDAAAPFDPTMPLTCGQHYYFWLEVGPLVAESIEETSTPLPVEHLPPEARLKVALFAFENEIRIIPGADVGELQLLPDGSVLVAHQATQPQNILPESDLLEKRLFFPVHTPEREGTFHLRCNIYYEQVLVQSRLIHARVMREPHPVEQALRSVLDYNLTQTLDPAYMDRIAPHRLSIMLNQSSNGTHVFYFFGAQDDREVKHDVSLDGHTLQNLIHKARGALRKAAWNDEGAWTNQEYKYDSPLNLDRLKTDLIHLAIQGWRFYFKTTQIMIGAQPQVMELADLMLTPGFVQIALRKSARLVLPMALFYDYPLSTNARNINLCPSFVSALSDHAPLEENECFQGSCPSRGNKTIVCPSGFWGYLHNIGMPLSVTGGLRASLEIHYQQAPQFTVCVSTDPRFRLRRTHEQALRSIRPGLGWRYADSLDDTFKLLKEKAHLVYFYCHGGVVDHVPYIQVGSEDEVGITPDNLLAEEVYWDEPRPFVFINGCHTTALEPEVALEFVSAFVNTANASGVMGTEITVFEPLAKEFAEAFLRRFLAGATISEAVRGARLALLKAGNPLGLVYIPFVMATLRLVEQPVCS